MNNREIQAWLLAQLAQPGLPDLLRLLKMRANDLTQAAIQLGDTENEKSRVAELLYVIWIFEHFNEYADTGTETAEG